MYAVGFCEAQTNTAWTTISTNNNSFVLSVPPRFLVDTQGDTKIIHAFADGLAMKIETKSVKNPKSLVKDSYYPKDGRLSVEKFEKGDFVIWKMDFFDEKVFIDIFNIFDKKVYSTIIHAGSPKEYFEITVASDSRDNRSVARFLNSIKIEGKNLLNTTFEPTSIDNKPTTFANLVVSGEVAMALAQQDRSSIIGLYKTIKEKNTIDFSGYSRRLIILRRPGPGYTDEARMNSKQGTIKAKVQFLKSGKIGEIVVDPSLDRGLASNVGRAVMDIKFVPAEIDGKPVDVTRILEYKFSIY